MISILKEKINIIFVILVIFIAGFYVVKNEIKNKELNTLKEKYAVLLAMPSDTVTVSLFQLDTLLVQRADTIVTETIMIGDTVFVHKILTDTVVQPLFNLTTTVHSCTGDFYYNLKYVPLHIKLYFNDNYDLRKGFKVVTKPSMENVTVDWNGYSPPAIPKKFRFSIGVGYSRNVGPIVLSGVNWKTNEVGMFAKENSVGLYYKKFIDLF